MKNATRTAGYLCPDYSEFIILNMEKRRRVMPDWEAYKEITQEETSAALDFCCGQIIRNLDRFTDKFQSAYSVDQFYTPIDNVDWTNGFWTGELWLAYERALELQGGSEAHWGQYTGEAPAIWGESAKTPGQYAGELKRAAEIQVDSFYRRIVNRVQVDHHDMGFLYTPSCVAAYKLTGALRAREAAILAADQLLTRYQPVGEFIQAWGAMDEPENYRLIIDCLLNLPLLYWAAQETGNQKYREIAEKHIHTAVANVIREDGSTWHTFFFDMRTGKPDHGATCQGYRDGSAWARGQAWGVYGMACAYRYTKREDYIDKFRYVTEYYMKHLPEDLVPYWDLEFGDGSAEPRDSSAASIAVCGMLEMSKYLGKDESEYYTGIAKRILKSVYDNYSVKDSHISNGLVLHSTYSKRSPFNTCNHYGVDECNIWGDYFYMEALTRLVRDWNQYW